MFRKRSHDEKLGNIPQSGPFVLTLQQFEDYLYLKLGLDKAYYYGTTFRAFNQFIKGKELNEETCLTFLKQRRESGLSPSSYNNYLKALKHLVRAHGYTFLDSYKCLRTEKPYIDILEEDEMRLLLDIAYKTDSRRAIAIELFLRTGLRCDELIELRWENVKSDCVFITNTKTNKSRTAEILPDLAEKLHTLKGNHKTHVFGTKRGKLEAQRFNEFLKKCLVLAGIDKHVTAHTLRHSYGTLSSSKGFNTFTIKDAMGHSSIQTTQTYVHTTRNTLKSLAKAVSLGNYKPSSTEIRARINEFLSELQRSGYPANTTLKGSEIVITIPIRDAVST